MEDLHDVSRALSSISSQCGDWFPKVYGNRVRADKHGARYTVFVRTFDAFGTGDYARLFVTHDRQRALTCFRKFPKDVAYVEMRDALTDALIGECGRFDYRSEISELLDAAARCSDDDICSQRVQTRSGKRTIRTSRKQLLMKQAAALYAATFLPGGE